MRHFLAIAISYQSRIWMTRFDQYEGLFADNGDFDLPQSVNTGIAFDVLPNLTLMFDYRWIDYSSVGSVGNPSDIPLPFGSVGGPGFGWDDVNTFRFAAEWETTSGLTLRAGYSHGSNPVQPENVTINILAPGTIQDHITFGLKKRVTERQSFEFAFLFAPEATTTGIEVTPFGPNPGRDITVSLRQFEITFGWTIKFGKLK